MLVCHNNSYNSKISKCKLNFEFGVSLKKRKQAGIIPRIVRDCCKHIQDNGLSVEGLFRLSGSKAKIDATIRRFDMGSIVELDKLGIHVVCGVLKQYFRELPETIFPKELFPVIYSLEGK